MSATSRIQCTSPNGLLVSIRWYLRNGGVLEFSVHPGAPECKDYTRACYFGCLKRVSKSVQVLCSGMEAVMVLTLINLKLRALYAQVSWCGVQTKSARKHSAALHDSRILLTTVAPQSPRVVTYFRPPK